MLLTSEESTQIAIELSDVYFELAKSLTEYRFDNWAKLGQQNRLTLEKLEQALRNYSSAFNAEAVRGIISGLEGATNGIKEATKELKAATEKLQNLQHNIGIAAAAIQLGTAIFSGQLADIVAAVGAVDSATAPPQRDED